MLTFLKPKCPVNARQKAWVETRLNWLCNQFGTDRLLVSQVLLPTDECLSESDGTEQCARIVFMKLCRMMAIDASTVTLEFVPDAELPNMAGIYLAHETNATICIAESQLSVSQSLVATLTHELSHRVLLGNGVLTTNVNDHEYITDLYAVFVGLGIFAANSVVRESYENVGRWHAWRVGKQGYLTAREYGYALAVFAWFRQEVQPDWSRFLRLDAKSAFKSGLRYLRSTGDCLMTDSNAASLNKPDPSSVLSGLNSHYEGTRVSMLWNIRKWCVNSKEVVGRVVDQLRHKNPIIRAEAAATLGGVAQEYPLASARLIEHLRDHDPGVRAEAARALGTLHPDTAIVVPHLSFLIEDADRSVVFAALHCAAQYGTAAASLTPHILPVLKKALVDCDFPLSDMAVTTISRTSSNPMNVLRDYFMSDDELCRAALAPLTQPAQAALLTA